MWGQPPSAVQASAARQAFLASFPNLELNDNWEDSQTPLPHNSY
jgi:hypothetical protein